MPADQSKGRGLVLSRIPPGGAVRRLDTALVLRAYRAGLFPMADTRDADDIFWVEPRRRGILPLDRFHLPRSLARTLRHGRFRHSRDLAFGAVIARCAEPRPGREESWINPTIRESYEQLHAEGHAHSIEVWDAQGALAGGLYGVRIGGAFFGESMFSRAPDASKVALAHLVARMRLGGFCLLDTQFLTVHLARFGAEEVARRVYLGLLEGALAVRASWEAADRALGLVGSLSKAGPDPRVAPALPGEGAAAGRAIVQLLSQTS